MDSALCGYFGFAANFITMSKSKHFIGQQYFFIIINQLIVVDVLVVLSLSSTTFYKIVALRSLRVESLLLMMLHRVQWRVSLIYRRGCQV